MDNIASDARPARGQLMLIGGVLAACVAVLAIGYFLFVRTEYAVLAEGLRPAEAAAIVAELDKGGKPYRLRAGGSTILVPKSEADATRIVIAGSDAAARGQIGFELFNKSDMGLTNFAQKINYQRALQGELVRTIMQMDGVDTARVHLALPEKALFRGDRTEPKAAVTVAMKPGQTADAARVTGIQRLIAAAVPDLPESKVVVLDSAGRVISATAAPDQELAQPADMAERTAIEEYYRARARGAIERRMPGVKVALRALVLPLAKEAAPEDWTPSGERSARNYRLRLILISEMALDPEDEIVMRDAVIQATGANPALGDAILFETGPVEPAPAPRTMAAPVPVETAAPFETHIAPPPHWPPLWPAGLIAVLLAGLLAWRIFRAKPALDANDHAMFADRLRRQLALHEDGQDAVA